MYLDSNHDGILDWSDRLVVRGKLSNGFRKIRRGDLIEFSDSALITAKPYDEKGHVGNDHNSDDYSKSAPLGINELGYEHLSFLNSDMNQVFHDHGAAHAHAHFQEMI